MRNSRRAVATVVGVLALIATAATPAQAAEPADHCVIFGAAATDITCDTSPEAASDQRNACTPYGLLRVAKFWDLKNFDPSLGTLVMCRPDKCSGQYDDIDYQIPDLGSWKNRISSLKTFSNTANNPHCDVRLFDNGVGTDPRSTWIDRSPDLSEVGGGWNNRANSLRLT